MITAQELFDEYPWANFITRDISENIYIFKRKPKIKQTNRFNKVYKYYLSLGRIKVKEFEGKNVFEYNIIERIKQ